MGDWGNAALQAAFWTYANSLRREAKLCDIILYVQGRKGAMVGYPAHKLLLISASKYFKLLFEREDLRNACHFPHLTEDGLFTVLDIVYGHEVADNTNFEDALMAARFLQVDCAVEVLEHKKMSLENPQPTQSSSRHRLRDRDHIDNYKDSTIPAKKARSESPTGQQITTSPSAGRYVKPAEMRLYRNVKNQEHHQDKDLDEFYDQDSSFSHVEQSEGDNQEDSNTGFDSGLDVKVKPEPDVDLTMEDADGQDQGLPQLGFTHGNASFAGHTFGTFENQTEGLMFPGHSDVSNPELMYDQNNQQRANPGGLHRQRKYSSVETEKTYECEICGKPFNCSGNLKKHMLVHSGVKPLSCKICGKRFAESGNLNKHMATHPGERFACDICGKEFAVELTLMRHKQRVHPMLY